MNQIQWFKPLPLVQKTTLFFKSFFVLSIFSAFALPPYFYYIEFNSSFYNWNLTAILLVCGLAQYGFYHLFKRESQKRHGISAEGIIIETPKESRLIRWEEIGSYKKDIYEHFKVYDHNNKKLCKIAAHIDDPNKFEKLFTDLFKQYQNNKIS